MNKKAFTLIELLAVIVILAIIAVIAIPGVLGIIEDSRRSAVEESARNISRAAEIYYADNILKGLENKSIDLEKDLLPYNGEKPEKGLVIYDSSGRAYTKLYMNGYCVKVDYDNSLKTDKIEKDDCSLKVILLSINPNDGEVSEHSREFENGGTIGELPIPTKEGYTFKGWVLFDGTIVTAETIIRENMTIYADWEANEYNVIFDAKGGNVDKESINVTFNNTYKDLPTPTRTDYIFLGWYLDEENDTLVTNDTVVTNAFNHYLYARWKSIYYKDEILNGADPVLDMAMIPVIINDDGTLKKADTKLEWYNYSNKEWANAVLVSSEKRDEYKNAIPGTMIETKYVKAYYVWIPRYKYQIFTDLDNLEVVGYLSNKSNYVNKTNIINIKFETKEIKKSTGRKKGEWLTHPAFTFGNEELNGLWVGKFETTGTVEEPTVLGYDSRYVETSDIVSLREQNVSTLFDISQNINYGINNFEAGMLKNSEWGSVAYLTASIYGQGKKEVRINNSRAFNTGCAATVIPTKGYKEYLLQTDHSEGPYEGCENEWYTEVGKQASTTGNLYGIYDMSGGAWEYMMAVMENNEGSQIPASGQNVNLNSNFIGTLTYPEIQDKVTGEVQQPIITDVTSETGVAFPDNKYYDLYSYGIKYDGYENGHIGDATYELDGFANWDYSDGKVRYHSGWNQDYARFVSNEYPWLRRGGLYTDGTDAGIFAFYSYHGAAHRDNTFRSILR